MQFQIRRIGMASLMACLLCGCSPEKPEYAADLVPVSGTVTIKGKPLAGAAVIFSPTTNDGRAAGGLTDEAGHYTLITHKAGEGAVPGQYNVSFSKYVMPDGSPLPPNTPPADVEAVESIPPIYSTLGESRLSATVPKGGDEFNFEL